MCIYISHSCKHIRLSIFPLLLNILQIEFYWLLSFFIVLIQSTNFYYTYESNFLEVMLNEHVIDNL